MTLKGRFLVACTAAILSLGAAAVTPATADNMTAHQASRMMRQRTVMMHHRAAMMKHNAPGHVRSA